MKKVLLSSVVVLSFVIYSLFQKSQTSESAPLVSTQTTPQSTPSGSSMTTAVTYKDGIYTGSSADAYYGNIQVKATISNGKISDVQFLNYPNDRRESQEINQQAMPLLKTEAIQAQSAKVDIISGATDSSNAFQISLQSALDQAKA